MDEPTNRPRVALRAAFPTAALALLPGCLMVGAFWPQEDLRTSAAWLSTGIQFGSVVSRHTTPRRGELGPVVSYLQASRKESADSWHFEQVACGFQLPLRVHELENVRGWLRDEDANHWTAAYAGGGVSIDFARFDGGPGSYEYGGYVHCGLVRRFDGDDLNPPSIVGLELRYSFGSRFRIPGRWMSGNGVHVLLVFGLQP